MPIEFSRNINAGILIKFLCVVIVVFFLFPTRLYATAPVSMTNDEKKRVDRGEIIVREVPAGDAAGKTFEAIGRINASRESIVQVLTAYETYPEFMPNVSNIEIVEQNGNDAILNYTLSLPLGKIKKYRLKISVAEHENFTSVMQWQMLDWPGLKTAETIKNTTGFWQIEEKGLNRSLVLYHVYTDPGPVPFGLGWIVDYMSKNSVPEALTQTKARAEEVHVQFGK